MAEPYNPAQAGQATAQPPTQPQQPTGGGETFLQRQNRLYGQQSATSPVSSTGRITAAMPRGTAPRPGMPATQQTYDAPQLQEQGGAYPARSPYAKNTQQSPWAITGAARDAQMNSMHPAMQQGSSIQQGQAPVYTQQQYRPAQQQAPFVQPSAGTAGANQVAGPAGGWQTYAPAGNVPVAQQYAPGSQNTYQAANVQQFQQPRDAAMDESQRQMVSRMMANPHSMSAQGVDALKGQQAEQAMLMNKQQQGQMMSALAGRGIDPGSQGYAQMQQRQLGQEMNQNILAGNRQIDIDKMKQDRTDELGALGAADAWQNSNLGRAVTGYETGLRGTEASRAENTTQLDSERDLTKMNWEGQQRGFNDAMASSGMENDEAYKAYQSRFGAQAADQNRQAGNMGLLRQDASNATQNRSIDVQNSQFGTSMEFDREKFGYQKSQDAQGRSDAQAAQGAADDRWAEQQAYQYQRDQQAQQDQYLQWLMQGGGGY